MSKSDENRSAMSGLVSQAKESAEGESSTEADDDQGADRERFSVYADRSVFDRVRVWSTFLDVPQADILERAISRYCNALADEHNDGDDPEIPSAEGDTDPLL